MKAALLSIVCLALRSATSGFVRLQEYCNFLVRCLHTALGEMHRSSLPISLQSSYTYNSLQRIHTLNLSQNFSCISATVAVLVFSMSSLMNLECSSEIFRLLPLLTRLVFRQPGSTSSFLIASFTKLYADACKIPIFIAACCTLYPLCVVW